MPDAAMPDAANPTPKPPSAHRIAIVTCSRTDIAMTDNPPLVDALAAHGIDADLVVWDDPDLDHTTAWSRYDLAVIRTTWDYFEKLEAFKTWLPMVSKQTAVANDASIIAWNLDKRYLPKLEAAGAKIVPTRTATPDDLDRTIADMQLLHGPVAVKPSVGGGAKGLALLAPGEQLASSDRAEALGPAGVSLVQPVVESVRTEGEMALVWIDDAAGGSVKYAVQKVPKTGDIRVQPEWGASYHPAAFTGPQAELARDAIRACEQLVARPLYARVDMVRLPDDTWALMELEVIEPEIFFAVIPGTADHLASAIAAHPALKP
ncbi:MAG: hypothetical protein AAF235_02535 [Planctomycetota bacterium]